MIKIHGYCYRHYRPCPYHANEQHLNDKSGEENIIKKTGNIHSDISFRMPSFT